MILLCLLLLLFVVWSSINLLSYVSLIYLASVIPHGINYLYLLYSYLPSSRAYNLQCSANHSNRAFTTATERSLPQPNVCTSLIHRLYHSHWYSYWTPISMYVCIGWYGTCVERGVEPNVARASLNNSNNSNLQFPLNCQIEYSLRTSF